MSESTVSQEHSEQSRGASEKREALSAPRTTPKFCDLIMKGGITSGVVYPRLIATLSKSYVFKNIGGSSAGAIAAAGAAAAEYRRQTQNSDAGFSKLSLLPKELGEPAKGRGATQSFLFHLFQPHLLLQRHFAVAVSALNAKNAGEGIKRVFWALIEQFISPALGLIFLATLPGLAILYVIVSGFGSGAPLETLPKLLGTGLVWLFALGIARIGARFTHRLAIVVPFVAAIGTILAMLVLADTGDSPLFVKLLSGLGTGIAWGIAIAGAFIAIGAYAAKTMARDMPGNNFSFCTGMPTDLESAKPIALTPRSEEHTSELQSP